LNQLFAARTNNIIKQIQRVFYNFNFNKATRKRASFTDIEFVIQNVSRQRVHIFCVIVVVLTRIVERESYQCI